ncbi:class I SAM-dependent methyltransferase [Thalassospira sp. TSL5-1]|uniref:class I SAM-dependent methyltransferase n=1 Tax=Thalassospira sp. TSL5-1 TaxID=1544451 RepID=UPI00093B4D97|nr:class I SAM-dependent methyltransferase [Thalassospira sp. TSL5-1]OKH88024.1 ATP synthase subunit beta [Thalassospira sp. TSL5-1]
MTDKENQTSPLLDHLKRRISIAGPISVADYMTEALAHPQWGYYRKQDPFGQAGDFVTAPEISQMFGELIGLWVAVTWQQMGSPSRLQLVELGPGRGTLMADALRAVRNVPGFCDALTVRFVETSPVLRTHQQTSIMPYGVPAVWHDSFEDIPENQNAPMVVIANEFFDALPVRQFQFGKDGWRERLVAISAESGELCFTNGPLAPMTDALVPVKLRPTAKVGDVFEASPMAISIANQIAHRINRDGGAALMIDYGHPHSAFGDTLQALRHHKYHPVLAMPGDADLTTHVDFGALARTFSQADARTGAVLGQGTFLKMLGIEQRAELLKQSATVDQAKAIDAALNRLVDADQMGTLFKVLIAYGRESAPPPCVSGAEG